MAIYWPTPGFKQAEEEEGGEEDEEAEEEEKEEGKDHSVWR